MKLSISVLATVLATSAFAQQASLPDSQQVPALGPSLNAEQSAVQDKEVMQEKMPGGYTVGDVAFLTEVERAMTVDSALDDSLVSADIQNGQLILKGNADSEQAKKRAGQIAAPFAMERNLKTVNQIQVKP